LPGRKYNGRGVIPEVVRLACREAGLITKGEWHLIRAMRNGGVSISDIARQMGLDRKTVRKALVADCWPDDAAKPRVVRPSKLDPFRDYIRARLEGTPSLSAVRIYEEIAGQGYSGRISILKEFVHEIKEEHRIRAVVRFETLPGQQAQVDWGYVGSSAILGDDRPIYGFAMVLGYSRMRFVCFTHRMDIHTLMRCHEEAFAYFGGHSREILYDNMKTIIVRPKAADTPALLNPEFASFAGYYGFDVRSCAPYRAQTKGKVERLIGYVKDSFVNGRVFESLDGMNRQALLWCDEVNSKAHGTTGKMPREELAREGLIPAQGKGYDTSRVSVRIVSRDCLISYEGNRYEMPYRLAGKLVVVKDRDDGSLRVYREDELVIEYGKASGKGEIVRTPGLNDELWKKVLGRRWLSGRPRIEAAVGRPVLVVVGREIPLVEVERRDLGYYEKVAG